MGFNVIIRIQPYIHALIDDKLEEFIKIIKDSGCKAFQTEGLKLRVITSKSELLYWDKINNIVGENMVEYFKQYGEIDGGDRQYPKRKKRELFSKLDELAKKYDLEFYNADNFICKEYGCSSECCGTKFLRDYKVWCGNRRTKTMGDCTDKATVEFQKCLVNFTRNQNYREKTIGEVTEIKNKLKESKDFEQGELF